MRSDILGFMGEFLDHPNISEKTISADVDGWDSLKNIKLVVAVEKKFGLQFDLNQLGFCKTVGDFLDLAEL